MNTHESVVEMERELHSLLEGVRFSGATHLNGATLRVRVLPQVWLDEALGVLRVRVERFVDGEPDPGWPASGWRIRSRQEIAGRAAHAEAVTGPDGMATLRGIDLRRPWHLECLGYGAALVLLKPDCEPGRVDKANRNFRLLSDPDLHHLAACGRCQARLEPLRQALPRVEAAAGAPSLAFLEQTVPVRWKGVQTSQATLRFFEAPSLEASGVLVLNFTAWSPKIASDQVALLQASHAPTGRLLGCPLPIRMGANQRCRLHLQPGAVAPFPPPGLRAEAITFALLYPDHG